MLYKQIFYGITVVAFLLISFSIKANEVPIPRTELSKITPGTLETDYASERAYRPEGHKQPIIGLAMSGGGTKAAMFSHGVMHGLHDSGVLDYVDAISTVSGSSYVAYWYFIHQLESQPQRQNFQISQIFDDCVPTYWTKGDKHDTDLQDAMEAAKDMPPKEGMLECAGPAHFRAKGETRLNDPYRWQAHIVRWPDVIQDHPVYLDGGIQNSPERQMTMGVAKALISEPWRQESAVPRIYQYGIERTWGLNPIKRDLATLTGKDAKNEEAHWKYSNNGDSDNDIKRRGIRVNPGNSSWSQLRDELYIKTPASSTSPIMPLLILNSTTGSKTDGNNTSHIFEMTPFGYGSAKLDNKDLGYFNNPEKFLVDDLGTSVRASAGFADAQGIEDPLKRFALDKASDLLPALRWGIDKTIMTKEGKKQIHLSDGGGSENLGLYSLLKRGLEDIIVVDTSSDVEGDMSDICAVQKALKDEEGVSLEFKALHNFEKVCEGQPKRVKHQHLYNVSAWKNPVVKGTATWPPINGNAPRVSNIWLIKAAWDEKAVVAAYKPIQCGRGPGKQNCFLEVFYGHNSGKRSKKDGYMFFPQLSTVSTTYNSSSYLFWGYRELGRMLASNLTVNKVSGRIELINSQCLQVDLERTWRSKRRPEIAEDNKLTKCIPVS